MTEVPVHSVEHVVVAESPLLAAGQPLMARAAAVLAQVVGDGFAASHSMRDAATPAGSQTLHARQVLVLAGSGNNGGDALYAAALLAEEIDVDILTVGARVHERGLATALAAGARRVEVPSMREACDSYELIVDGILGVGTTDPTLRGNAREAIQALLPAVQSGRSRVIAVDLPSGLHPETGEAGEVVLPASVTVTFGAVKPGLVRGHGPELAGEIVLGDIGLGPELQGFVPIGTADVARVIQA